MTAKTKDASILRVEKLQKVLIQTRLSQLKRFRM